MFGKNSFTMNALQLLFRLAETEFLLFSLFHMLGMSSACTNPLLYGFINEKFQQEFLAVRDRFLALFCPSQEVKT